MIPGAVEALRPGGMLACWIPTTLQLETVGAAIRAEPLLVEARTSEILQRYWHVAYNSVRPDHRMVGHTGFLITAWRLAAPEQGGSSPTPDGDPLPADADRDNNAEEEPS